MVAVYDCCFFGIQRPLIYLENRRLVMVRTFLFLFSCKVHWPFFLKGCNCFFPVIQQVCIHLVGNGSISYFCREFSKRQID